MNSWYWMAFAYPLTFKTFLFYQSASLWFDTFHAIGNAIFLAVFGLKTIGILDRFKRDSIGVFLKLADVLTKCLSSLSGISLLWISSRS